MSSIEIRRGFSRRWPRSLQSPVVLAFVLSSGLVAVLLTLSVYAICVDYLEHQRMHSAEQAARVYRTDLRLNADQIRPAETSGNDGDHRYSSSPVDGLDSRLRMLRYHLIVSSLAVMALGTALGMWARQRLLSPLHRVAAAAAQIASGETRLRLTPTHDRDLDATVDAFNSMVESLQRRIERERRLVGDIGHELRTPMATLVTSVEVMNQHADDLPERSRRALDFLSAELEHLRVLLDDMLELARVQAGLHRGDIELLSVGELLTHILAARKYSPQLLRIAADATIRGRKLELERAVGNLLDNADRHGGGVVAVGVARDENDVVIMVDDAGPGVPLADRERIFERFATVPTGRGSSAGSGIGLALVAETVAVHYGRVEYGERPDGGARFMIRLPHIAAPLD